MSSGQHCTGAPWPNGGSILAHFNISVLRGALGIDYFRGTFVAAQWNFHVLQSCLMSSFWQPLLCGAVVLKAEGMIGTRI